MPKKNKSGKKKSGTAAAQKAPEETKQVVEPEPEPEVVADESATQADGGAKKKKRKRKKKKNAAATEEPAAEEEYKELTAKEKLERRKMILQAKRGKKFTPEEMAAIGPDPVAETEDGEETEEQKREKARALQTVIEVAPQKPKEKERYTYTELPGQETKAAPETEAPAAGGKKNKKKRDAKVPNVRPKFEPEEEKKMNAMFGTLQDQDTVFIMKKDGTTENVEVEAGQSASDLKSTPTLVIKDCKNVTVNVNRRVVKALIQNCHNCTFVFNQSILTNTLECWRSENVTIETAKTLKTMQLDIMAGCHVIFHELSHFGAIIWNAVEGLQLTFKDSPRDDMKTGFAEIKAELPDSCEVDQFIIRHLDGAMKQERCVRLKNGFLSTEREAIAWDKKNSLAFDRYKESFLKEAGVAINRDPNEVIQKPNAPCACGSGKKYKKCCQNKKVVMGVAGDELTYQK